jgi:DNA-binding CsgD family transcriptional regulator
VDAQSRWAVLVAETVTEAVEGMSLGIPPADTMARRLGRELAADAASHGWLDRHTGRYELSGWPVSMEAALLTGATFALSDTDPEIVHWVQDDIGITIVSWPLPTSEETDDQSRKRRRVLGFAKRGGFTREELALLTFLRRPMIALIDHGDRLGPRGLAAGGDVEGPDLPHRAATLGLTSRELEVLCLLAEGLLAVTIAGRLAISTRTVHRHLAHIYAKLDTHDRLSTVIRAHELRLLTGAGVWERE